MRHELFDPGSPLLQKIKQHMHWVSEEQGTSMERRSQRYLYRWSCRMPKEMEAVCSFFEAFAVMKNELYRNSRR